MTWPMSGRVTSVAVRDDAYRRAMRHVEVGGRGVELHIRRSPRVRWHRINFRPGEPAELVVRPRASEAEIRGDRVPHTVARAAACGGAGAEARARPADTDGGAG